MKVLHSAALLDPPSGILNQMRWEQQVADEAGIDWQVKMYCPSGAVGLEKIIHESTNVSANNTKNKFGKAWAWLKLRWGYHRWLKSQEDNFDIFLLRYYVHDPFQLLFLRSCKKPVYLVHHTLEGPELAMSGGMKDKLRSFLDDLLAGPSIRAAYGIVGVTNEIIEYERGRAGQINKQSFLYPNGIVFENNVVDDNRGEIPEILFVASGFASWHGLDLLLAEMKKSEAKFILHLVGDIFEADMESAKSDSRVVIHGRKSHSEIKILAAQCWGGVSCFGLHRVNMKEACTLKVREYLMLGMPVYAGYIEVLPDDFPFYKCGDVSIDKILSFFEKYRDLSRNEISEKSKFYIDKKQLLNSLYSELMSAHD